jgi:hypothetical protein
MAAMVLAVCFLALGSALGAGSGEEVKVKGLIIDRTGETLTLKTADGKVTVVLDDDTKVQQPKGLVKLRKKSMSAAALIPGLKVSVDGVSDDQNRVVAKSITFSGDDLNTAESIQAGLNPTEQRVAGNKENIASNQQNIAANQQNIEANKQGIEANAEEVKATNKRFSELGDYDVKSEEAVRFAVGSTKLSAQAKQELMKLARDAVKPHWLPHTGEGICRLQRQCCCEPEIKHGARPDSDRLSDPGL